MAMIKCPECSSKVSDSAFKCPSCGFQLNEEHERPESTGCLVWFAAFWLMFWLFSDK